jgi:hypothetical protein
MRKRIKYRKGFGAVFLACLIVVAGASGTLHFLLIEHHHHKCLCHEEFPFLISEPSEPCLVGDFVFYQVVETSMRTDLIRLDLLPRILIPVLKEYLHSEAGTLLHARAPPIGLNASAYQKPKLLQ